MNRFALSFSAGDLLGFDIDSLSLDHLILRERPSSDLVKGSHFKGVVQLRYETTNCHVSH